MRQPAVSRFAICLAAGLLLGVAAIAQAAVTDKQQQLKALRGQISNLESQLGQDRKQQDSLEAELKAAEKQIGRTARRQRVLAASRQRQQKKLRQLQQERERQTQALGINREALANQLRSAYIMGRQERLKILLNQQDPAVVSRMLVYYDYFNRARTQQMAQIADQLNALQRTERELTEEQRRLDQILAEVEDEKLQMEIDQQRRQKILSGLSREIRSKDDQLKGFKQNEKQLQALVKRLQEQLQALPLETEKHRPFKTLRGKLQWPAKGRLAARFGTSRGGNLKWDGVLIAAPEGREVQAIHHGRVAFADWLRGFGLLLIIDHGNGYMSLYGHNQSLFKEVGEWVEPGEAVALVGSSGGGSRPGVYFGIRYNGRPVNPKKWCRGIRGNRIAGNTASRADQKIFNPRT